MEKSKYVCVFEDKQCPVKATWKLSPESLAGFCKVCVEKIKWDALMKTIEIFASIQKKTPSNELQNERLKIEREIEMRKLDIEEKKLEYQKSVVGITTK